MNFKAYPDLIKFGQEEVEDIQTGICVIMPKIDGTNASVWLGDDGAIKAGSRNKELNLSVKNGDNAGFYAAIHNNKSLLDYLTKYPSHTVYGEWLVPNQIKHYQEAHKRKFWVFDVFDNETGQFIPYAEYEPVLSQYEDLSIIPVLATIENGTLEQFLEISRQSKFLLKEIEGAYSEGVVIKRYGYVNKYGRQTFAKIINDEYKENKGIPKENASHEELLTDFACTGALVGKVYGKILIENDNTWSPKFIGRLLGEVYHDVVTEELWDFVKKNKGVVIDFSVLRKMVEDRTKQLALELNLPLYNKE